MDNKSQYDELLTRLKQQELTIARLQNKIQEEMSKEQSLLEVQKREIRIKKLLLSIRAVNHLIVQESDKERLIAAACKQLTQTMCYNHAWIALLNDEGTKVIFTANSGIDTNTQIFKEHWTEENFPSCLKTAIKNSETVIIANHRSECSNCPHDKEYSDKNRFIHRLSYKESLLGVIAVSLPSEYLSNEEDSDLFHELANDLAYAIYRIDESKKLHDTEERLRMALFSAQLGTWDWNIKTGDIAINDRWAEMLGYKAEEIEINVTAWESLINPADKELVFEALNDHLEGKSDYYEAEHRMKHKSGEWIWILDRGKVIERTVDGKALRACGTHLDITNHKRNEEILKEYAEYQRVLFTDSRIPLVVMDEQSGKYLDCNPAAAKIYGYSSREDVLGLSPLDFSAPYQYNGKDSASEARYMIDICKEKGSHIFKWKHQRPDGQTWDAEVYLMLFRYRDRQLIQFSLQDVTEKKQVEELLKFQSNILNQIQDRVTVTDLAGYITYINDSGCSKLGRTKEDLLGKHVSIYGEDSKKGATQKEIIQKTLHNGHWQGEVINRIMDGKSLIMYSRTQLVRDNDGNPQAICGISTDITERKNTEESLKESEERFRAISEYSHNAICIIDENARITWINSKMIEVSMYTSEQILNASSFIDFLAPESIEPVVSNFRKFLAGEEYEHHYFFSFIRADGEKRVLEKHMKDFTDRHSKKNLVVSMLDVTEIKKAEEEKNKLQKQLMHAQKMESIGRLAGGVAHDLNNLLTPIIGYSEMLLEEMSENSPSRDDVKEISHAGMRARDLVRQLLAFSRKQMLEFKPLNLNELLQRFEKLLRRTIRENIDVKLVLSSALPDVLGDVGQLEQVVMNLVVNAQDSMPDGGSLVLETSVIELDQTYAESHDDISAGTYALLSITDTGHGIQPEILPHIFEPFFTTKDIDKGTGLGLSTCYGIIRQHDGFISVSSIINKGTTFIVYLPLINNSTIHNEISSEEIKNLRGIETILLVEDDSQVLELTYVILKRQGYTVLCAENGKKALELLKNHYENINLIVTDVIMPGMSGKELYNRVKIQYPKVKVLYMSGYTSNIIDQSEIIKEGLNFIQKPFTVHDLAVAIREILDETKV